MGRRNFLKTAALAGLGTAAASAGLKNTAEASGIIIKEHKKMDDIYAIDPARFKRFNPMDTMFMRAFMREKGFEHIPPKLLNKQPSTEPGMTQLDLAFMQSVSFLEEKFTGPVPQKFGFYNSGMYSWEQEVAPQKFSFESRELAALAVKKGGKLLGGGLVGIAPFDERWLYTHTLQFIPGKKPPLKMTPMEKALPFVPKSIIMVAVEMNYEVSKLNPSYLGNSAPNQGYSYMAVVAPALAHFIQRLGYKAIPFGNDTFRNVPMAISAGLGEGSRMGVLITEKFGPRVRLCGVATEMELPFDKPITFGVTEFCRICMKCADNCPSEAIPKDKNPSFDGQHNRSNSVGVKKWHVNAEKCLSFWGKLGCGCMNCIACCPYNKLDTWNHDYAKLATVIPGVRHLARSLDEVFGYGKVSDEKAMKKFWRKD